MPLINKQKREYIKAKGLLCPVCKSDNSECYDHMFDNELIYGYNWCRDCNATWTDTFTLTDVELDENA